MGQVKKQQIDKEFRAAVVPTTACEARQMSDQMSCTRCGLLWDMNDPAPPKCKNRNTPKAKTPTAEKAKGRTFVVNERFARPDHIDLKRAEWAKKDRSVGKQCLARLRQDLKA